jgi:hypothetical protein
VPSAGTECPLIRCARRPGEPPSLSSRRARRGAWPRQAWPRASRPEDVIAQVGSLVGENALLKSDNAVLRNEIASLARRLGKVRAELDAIKRAVTRGSNAGDFKFSSYMSILHEIEQGVRPHRKASGRLVVLLHLPQQV